MVTWPVCSTSSRILRLRPSASSRELLELGMKANEVYSVTAKWSNFAFRWLVDQLALYFLLPCFLLFFSLRIISFL
jgi:hypothetical protein